MAGHSKWSNIKRKKEKTDAQKAKVFTKARDIVATKAGGDPEATSTTHGYPKAKAVNIRMITSTVIWRGQVPPRPISMRRLFTRIQGWGRLLVHT